MRSFIYIVIYFGVLAFTGLILWLRKLVLKRRLERGLGREVEDRELLSITEWMEATPAQGDTAEQKSRTDPLPKAAQAIDERLTGRRKGRDINL